MLEYGLAGKPVITTNVGNCSKVVENDVSGIIVEKEKPKLLAEGLLFILNNEDKARLYAQELKNKVQNHYSQEAYINKLERIYNEVLK